MQFSDLNLHPQLLSAIEKLGYTQCTPIQEQAIPHIVDGKDVAGLAQTGTGKTAAFVIPLMERILRGQPVPETASVEEKAIAGLRGFSEWKNQNFILILVPTRELAEQVMENVTKLGESLGIKACSIYGGTGYEKQIEALKAGVEFVIATPGRLIDLFKEHHVDLKQVRGIVFDEADRMFDMGFKDDMKYILSRIPKERQFLVFSATLNFDVLNTAYQFGSEPVEINISRDQAKAENVKDYIFHVGHEEKPQHLLSILKKHNPKQAIIFTNFKLNVEKIAKFLIDNGIPAVAISSLINQSQRNRVIEQFKGDNDKNIMVATDVAARGLDIKGVDLVINYELPNDSESYVHRIGRTGRAGTEGVAFSLVCDRDVESLSRIEDYLKHKLAIEFLEDGDLIKEFVPLSHSDYSRPFGDRKDRGHDRSGGHRGNRSGDRGGDRKDRGPRRDRQDYRGSDRGEKTDRGERSERTDRPERSGGERSHDRSARPARGPRHEGAEHSRHERRGPRPQGSNSASNTHQSSQHKKSASHRSGAKGHQHRNANSNKNYSKPNAASAAKVGIVQKIGGFFKKLLG